MFPALIGLGISAYQMYQGSKNKKNAENELNDYERQTLKNAYEDIQISTVGSDLMTQESQRTTANVSDAARSAGIRGVLGGVPKIQAQNNLANQEARKYLDDQVNQRQYAISEDEIKLRNMNENRDIANISALSSQVDAGKQDMWSGIEGMGTAAMSLANEYEAKRKKKKEDLSNIIGGVESRNMQEPYGPINLSPPPSIVPKSFYEKNDSFLNNYSAPKF